MVGIMPGAGGRTSPTRPEPGSSSRIMLMFVGVLIIVVVPVFTRLGGGPPRLRPRRSTKGRAPLQVVHDPSSIRVRTELRGDARLVAAHHELLERSERIERERHRHSGVRDEVAIRHRRQVHVELEPRAVLRR